MGKLAIVINIIYLVYVSKVMPKLSKIKRSIKRRR